MRFIEVYKNMGAFDMGFKAESSQTKGKCESVRRSRLKSSVAVSGSLPGVGSALVRFGSLAGGCSVWRAFDG